MWLLNTDNAVLQYFASPEDAPGGYAIISHIWDAEEDNFQDMMKLREVHKAGRTPPNPLSRVREKTRKCCELARSQGFQYVWIDSCCGDRSHVAELSKDVQSQFLYFSLAHVCYVYLPDVGGCDPRVTDSPFRASKWHTSPWALQELIAPDMVIFYSKEWTVLGTKQNLAPLLEEITSVPATVLIFKEDPTSFSVAARMSWASQRQPTARPEEQAYSLLGIMGVSMDVPPYGEGWRAFQRLQEEITKQLADTTVFVWGDKPALSYSEVTRIVRGLPPVSAAHTHHADESFLFAPAPSVFKSGFAETRSMPHLPIGDTMYTLDTSNLSTFTVTSNAVLAHIPVIELKDQRILIAFISCSMDNKPLGLVLEKCPNTSSGVPLYDVGLDDPNGSGTFRLVTLDDVSEGGSNGGRAGDVTFVWRTIHIRGRHIHDPSQDFQRVPMNRDLSSFYLPRLLLKKFGGRFLPRKPVVSTEHDASLLDQKVSISLQPAASPNSSAQDDSSAEASLGKESLPATFLFFADVTARRLPFLVHFGRCSVAKGASGESGAHWAKVERYDGGGDAEWFEFQPSIPTHACLADHISGWQNQQKTFPIAFKPITYGIRLSFSESEAFGTTKVLVPDIVTAYNR